MNKIIGVNVSKDAPEAFSTKTWPHRRFANTARGIADPIKWGSKVGDPPIAFEATGAHNRLPDTEPGARGPGTPFHKVKPRQARRFTQPTAAWPRPPGG